MIIKRKFTSLFTLTMLFSKLWKTVSKAAVNEEWMEGDTEEPKIST